MHYGMRRQIVCFLAAITSLATKAAAESLKSEQTPLASLTPLRLDQVKVDGEFGRRIGQIIENDLLTVTSNTGRLAALMLSNVCIVPYGRGEPFDEELLRGDDTWLLLPDAKSSVPRGRPQRLVLLDATFRQARRMYREISGLRLLPQCALNSPEQCAPGRRISARADGLSTIEAIATALAQFESPTLAVPLMAAYAEFVRRADISRGQRRPHD